MPLDFFCWDCGAPFELSISNLKCDDCDPSCPVCDSLRIGADYESLVRQFDVAPCVDGEGGGESGERLGLPAA